MSDNSSQTGNTLSPADQQKLEEAELLFEDEKPGQAAPLFVELANKLTSTQPKRAATLHAQAALAYVAYRNEVNAVTQARAALHLFYQHHMTQAETFYYNKIISELNDRKLTKAANMLVNEFSEQITMPNANLRPKPEQPFEQHASAHLPSLCPHCGAPVRSDEGQWVDGNTMLCMYCGTPIQVTME